MNHLVLIDCEDQKGLVYKVTDILYKFNLNIISNDEFVEKETNHFFMRSEVAGELDESELNIILKKVLPNGCKIEIVENKKKKIVLLVTKESHCLGDLLIRQLDDELNAEIVAVISNRENLRELTEKFNIPFLYIPAEGISREEHECKILEALSNYQPQYLVLAKYMRVLSSAFVERFPNRIINIHHSFLPAFIGANPYRQAYERGVKIIGATAHFVNHKLDEGPIISQGTVPVNHTYSVKDMAQAGRNVEKIVLAQSLKLVFENRLFVSGNKTIILD